MFIYFDFIVQQLNTIVRWVFGKTTHAIGVKVKSSHLIRYFFAAVTVLLSLQCNIPTFSYSSLR